MLLAFGAVLIAHVVSVAIFLLIEMRSFPLVMSVVIFEPFAYSLLIGAIIRVAVISIVTLLLVILVLMGQDGDSENRAPDRERDYTKEFVSILHNFLPNLCCMRCSKLLSRQAGLTEWPDRK